MDDGSLFLTITGPALFFLVILYGIHIAVQGSGILFFFQRPANLLTLFRSLFVLTGVILGHLWISYAIPILSWLSVILMALGYFGDCIDGWLARREKTESVVSAWGPWYDRESDSILLLLSSLAIAEFDGIPLYIIVPGISRYFFALIFGMFPTDCTMPRNFTRYSKTAAFVYQTVTVLIWATLLLSAQYNLPFDILSIQITYLIPVVTLIILSSFSIEFYYRLKSFISKIPPGYRYGIFRSFLIYYYIPFRYSRMKVFYRQFIQPSDLVFDIGCHLGNRTRVFLALGARVVSFEPQPSCRELLVNWFGSHDRVQLEYIALGKKKTNTTMLLSRFCPTLASIDKSWVKEIGKSRAFKGVNWNDRVPIEVHTLESMFTKYGTPNFIKIDTEGNERDILAGLSNPIECISFEFLPSFPVRAIDCIDCLMKTANYSFNFSIGESMKFSLKNFVSDDKMKFLIDSWPTTGKSGDIYAVIKKTP